MTRSPGKISSIFLYTPFAIRIRVSPLKHPPPIPTFTASAPQFTRS